MAKVGRDLLAVPQLTDSSQGDFDQRTGKYGEEYHLQVFSDKKVLGDEGSYFVATNPTIATAIACAVNATYDVTKSFFTMYNASSGSAAPSIYPEYIRMIPTVAPASGTSAHFAVIVEPASSSAPTAGNATATPKNVNAGCARTSICTFNHFTGGAVLTTPALTSAARVVSRGVLRSSIPVVHDEMVLTFGSEMSSSGPTTGASRYVTTVAPIVLTPGSSLRVVIWFPSNASTGISLEFEAGWIER